MGHAFKAREVGLGVAKGKPTEKRDFAFVRLRPLREGPRVYNGLVWSEPHPQPQTAAK